MYRKRSKWHKFKMWMYQITLKEIAEAISAALALGTIFAILTILPHFFH